MKKNLLFSLVSMFVFFAQAQLVLTTSGMGTVGVEYGASGDYTLHDPAGSEEVYLYMWINPDQTSPNLPFVYNDDWNDHTSLVVINWSASDGKFVGEINFNTHDFIGEGILPSSTGIDDFFLILRNQTGDSSTQSPDLNAVDFGFAGTQTLGNYDYQAEKASYYSNRMLYLNGLNDNEAIEISIFDSLGRQIFSKKMSVSQGKTQVDLSHLTTVFAVVHVSTSSDQYFVKKIVI